MANITLGKKLGSELYPLFIQLLLLDQNLLNQQLILLDMLPYMYVTGSPTGQDAAGPLTFNGCIFPSLL